MGAWAIGTFATERAKAKDAPEAAAVSRAAAAPFSPGGVLALQRSLGNRGVGALLQRVAYTPGSKHDHTPSGKWADVEKMLKSDRGVQAMIETRMPSPWPATGKWATDFKVEQSDYSDQDLRFAF